MQKHGRAREIETIVNVAAAIFYLGDWATDASIVNHMLEYHGLSRTSTHRALRTLRESGAILSKGYSVGKQHRAIKEVDLEHVLFTMSSRLITRDKAIFDKMQSEDTEQGKTSSIIPEEIWEHYLNGAMEMAKENAAYFTEAIRIARDSDSELAMFLTSYNAARLVGDYVKNWKREKQLEETESEIGEKDVQELYTHALLMKAAPSAVEKLNKESVDEYLNNLEHT